MMLCAAILAMPSTTTHAADPANTLVIELSNGGKVEIELLPKLAPKHVERIKQLAGTKFYDGVVFHRVIPNFMAQTGRGKDSASLPPLQAEFTSYPFKRGTVGAARTSDPNSATSQFFICFSNTGCAHLTGQYTVFGQVTAGMEHVDKVSGPQDRMAKVYLAAKPR